MNETVYEILMYFLKVLVISGVYLSIFFMTHRMMKYDIKSLEMRLDFFERDNISLYTKLKEFEFKLKEIRKIIE